MRFLSGLLLLFTTGCYVNRASYDPFSYAPENPCSYWRADYLADVLACEDETICPDLPSEEHVLCLAEVLDIALVNNPQTQKSWAEARQAAAIYGRSQSTFFPHIIAEYNYNHTRTAFLASQVEQPMNVNMERLLLNNQDTWGPRAQVSWILLDFGQRRYTTEAARYYLYFADYSHNEAVQSLVEQITNDYYNFLYEKKLLEAKEADVFDATETLDAAELGLKKGVRSVSDVLQARTQLLMAEISLSDQKSTLKTAYATLLSDMGLPANSEITTQKLPYVDPEELNLDCLSIFLDMAMQCRPDLLAARAYLRSAEMALKATKRAWLPVLDYSLDIGRTYFTGGFNSDYDMTSTLSIKMPIFTGFNIRNSIRYAKAQVEEAQASLKESELEVIKNVTTAHFNVTIAHDTLHSANQLLKVAQKQFEVARAQYRNGVNTILDVVSAQTTLFDARATQAQSIQQWFDSIAALTYSTGMINPNIEVLPCRCD